jgi:iron complex transport system ATP-binding protein
MNDQRPTNDERRTTDAVGLIRMIEANDVTCRLGRRTVIERISLSAQPGEVLALIGPNGAGKTTLLRALARLQRPADGVVLLEGQAVWQLRPRQVARRLALAQQDSAKDWPLTVEQAVELGRAPHRGWLLPLTAADRAVVESALRQAGVEQLRERRLDQLSGGEQRRVVLARALAQTPSILLLDEPTAGLDLKYQVAILELARQLAHRDRLAVVVTLHDLNQAALIADRVALLAAGHLLAVGAVENVLTPTLLEAAYDVPIVIAQHPIHGTPLITPLLGER